MQTCVIIFVNKYKKSQAQPYVCVCMCATKKTGDLYTQICIEIAKVPHSNNYEMMTKSNTIPTHAYTN